MGSKVACFDVSTIKKIMVSKFVSPELFNMGILKLSFEMFFSMMDDVAPVLLSSFVDDNNFVSHLSLDNFILKYLDSIRI
jgi:hypothetical protein